MPSKEERARAIEETVHRIRYIEADQGVTRPSLAAIKDELLALAAKRDLFPPDDFPPPEKGGINSTVYRLSEDDDHRFALYLNSAHAGHDTPPHDHATWAVIVGLTGEELNRFYELTKAGGVRQTGEAVVTGGTGVAFLPDDLHSIHTRGDEHIMNFHMYGLALEQLHARRYYDAEDNGWFHFEAHPDIREARAGR